MKKGKLLLLGSIFLTLALGGCTRDNYSTPQSDYVLNGVDVEFIRKASFDNYKEIEMGYYARTHATDTNLAKYAQRMVLGHGIAQQELRKLAERFKMSLPVGVNSDDQEEVNIQKNTPDGAQFDSKYRAYEIMDHRNALLLYQKEIKTGNHKDVVAYAQQYVDSVQSHLNEIQPIIP